MQIAEAKLVEELEWLANGLDGREHLDRFGNFEIEELAGVESLPPNRQCLRGEAHAVAGLARDVDVGEERHLHVN